MNTITYNPTDKKIYFTLKKTNTDDANPTVYVHGLDGFDRETVLNTLKNFGVSVELIRFEKLDKLAKANRGIRTNPNYDSTKINGQVVCLISMDNLLPITIEIFKEITGNQCELKKKSKNNENQNSPRKKSNG